MNDSKNNKRYTGQDRRSPRVEPGAAAPGTAKAGAVVPIVYKAGGRHSAITNSLYSWHSYKSWADKMKGNFDEKK